MLSLIRASTLARTLLGRLLGGGTTSVACWQTDRRLSEGTSTRTQSGSLPRGSSQSRPGRASVNPVGRGHWRLLLWSGRSGAGPGMGSLLHCHHAAAGWQARPLYSDRSPLPHRMVPIWLRVRGGRSPTDSPTSDRTLEAQHKLLVVVVVKPVAHLGVTVVSVGSRGDEAHRESRGRSVEPCALEDGDHLVDVV